MSVNSNFDKYHSERTSNFKKDNDLRKEKVKIELKEIKKIMMRNIT